MSQEPKQISVQEYIQTLRGQIVLSYDSAKETALRNFEAMTKKYIEQLKIVNDLKNPIKEALVKPKVEKKGK